MRAVIDGLAYVALVVLASAVGVLCAFWVWAFMAMSLPGARTQGLSDMTEDERVAEIDPCLRHGVRAEFCPECKAEDARKAALEQLAKALRDVANRCTRLAWDIGNALEGRQDPPTGNA